MYNNNNDNIGNNNDIESKI